MSALFHRPIRRPIRRPVRRPARRPLLATVAIVALVAGAVGCGGDEGGSAVPTLDGPAPQQVELVGFDMGYRPSALVVAQGGTIVFVNEGQVIHDLRVVGEPRFIHEVDRGETVTVPVTLDKGTYEMFCSIPGHKAAGMVGTLVVG